MSVAEILDDLKALHTAGVAHQGIRKHDPTQQIGVKLGDVRKVAKAHRGATTLIQPLWDTQILEARLVAVLWMKPNRVSVDQVDTWVRSLRSIQVCDWLHAYVVKKHPMAQALLERWNDTEHVMAARSWWALVAHGVEKNPEGFDVDALLARIDHELADAEPMVQWTMNMALAMIGIHHPRVRERALAIGERVGVYRDYPTSKGCTSPFAPAWIAAMVARQD
ncbi:MAG: DNA alkylation repair protein [Myxococcota bacterium]